MQELFLNYFLFIFNSCCFIHFFVLPLTYQPAARITGDGGKMMNLLEIEIHEAKITGSVVSVDYTISDMESKSDVNQQISKDKLIEYVIEKELNVYCSDVILGEYTADAANDYLVENLSEVVDQYLMENLV